MIREKFEKLFRLILAIAVFMTNFSYVPNVFADNGNNLGYTKGQVIDPVNSIGSTENEGDVKLIKTVSPTDKEGVYDVTISVEGKHKEETQVSTAPIYTVVVLDNSGSMVCNKTNLLGWCIDSVPEKYESAKTGAKTFATTLLGKFPQSQIALVTFSTNATVKRNFVSKNFNNVSFPSADGSTNLAGAIKAASDLLLEKKNENANAKLYMVILSDGYPEYYSYQPSNHSEEAKNAKDNGVEIFTIGYETTQETEDLLSSIATDSSHFVKANTGNIVESFNNIAAEIKVETPAGSDATIVDAVADGFNYVANSADVEVSVDGKNVSFDIGDITDEEKSVSFQIEVKKDLETGLHRTNDFAKVVYTDVNGEQQTLELEDSSKVYWEQVKYHYTVNYLEQGTEEVLNNPKEVTDAIYGRNYTEEAVTVEGYNLVEGTENPTTIEIEEDNQELTFYYTKKTDITYTVKYLEKDTEKELAKEKEVKNQTFLDTYSETAVEIEGYNVVGEATQTGTIDSENMVVTFYYTKKNDLTYIVDYIRDGIKVSLDEDNTYGDMTFGEKVNAVDIDINKYKAEGYTDGEITTSMPYTIIDGENRINVCYVRRTDLTYKVRYLEKDTEKELAKEKEVKNQTFKDNYTEVAKVITGYEVVGEATQTGTIDSENMLVTFYYTKKNDITYTVKYLEKDTNKELAKEKEVKNQTFLDTYSETAVEIEGYNVVGEATQTGTIDSENMVVTFYYTKKNDLTYIVDYIRDGIKVSLDEDNTYGDMTFEEQVNDYDIDINKYLIKGYTDGEITTSMPYTIIDGENRINVCYVKRTDLSYHVEYYFDGEINDEMTKTYDNIEFGTIIDSYEKFDVDGYEFVEDSGSIMVDVDSDNVIKVYYESIEIPAPQTGIVVANSNNFLQMAILIIVSSLGTLLVSRKLLKK